MQIYFLPKLSFYVGRSFDNTYQDNETDFIILTDINPSEFGETNDHCINICEVLNKASISYNHNLS